MLPSGHGSMINIQDFGNDFRVPKQKALREMKNVEGFVIEAAFEALVHGATYTGESNAVAEKPRCEGADLGGPTPDLDE